MKKSLLPLIFLLIVNCGSSKTEKPIKIKTFENKNLSVNYPSNWVRFGRTGAALFIPKTIQKNTHENEIEHVDVNRITLSIDIKEGIEEILKHYANSTRENVKLKNFRLIKLESNPKFIYKIESLRVYNSKPGTYKREEYFYVKDGKLEFNLYQMREDLFDFYHDDAMLIINSVQHKK